MKLEDKYSQDLICGIDEVGRGCLAGPVVAAAVIMPKERIEGVRDSKKLSKAKREELNKKILEEALAFGIGQVSNEVIDKINIKQATIKAMEEALSQVRAQIEPELVLIDAEVIKTDLPYQSIIKGDDLSYNIACASIIAKVYRDRMFLSYDQAYPGYSFETNMGYGTKTHSEAIKNLGYTSIHRRSFLKKMGDIKRNENW